jgi:DNA-binding response OmpR family regulator
MQIPAALATACLDRETLFRPSGKNMISGESHCMVQVIVFSPDESLHFADLISACAHEMQICCMTKIEQLRDEPFNHPVDAFVLPHLTRTPNDVGELRGIYPRVPVMIAHDQITRDERIGYLEQGITGFLAAPLDSRELAATVRAMKRCWGAADRLACDDEEVQCWALDPLRMAVKTPCGRQVPVSHSELTVLQLAARAEGQPVCRKEIIKALGHEEWLYDERRLETLISRLRRKLAQHTAMGFEVRGLRGKGYLFAARLREAPLLTSRA